MSTQGIKERPLPRFGHRTGLDYERLLYLEREVASRIGSWQPATGRRKALDLLEAIILTLICLRHNTFQDAVGEQARVSQTTVSRCIETLEAVVSCCLDCLAIGLQCHAARGDLVVDGFLIPTRDLTAPKGLFSGKRCAPSLNTQVVCDLHGRSVDAGMLLPGSTHDARAFHESGLAKAYEQHLTGNGPSMIGDGGYIGVVPFTPFKKPEYRKLTTAELLSNRQVNCRRWVVEQGIAHLRSWKVLKTGYRRPLRKADRTLQTVLRLQITAVTRKRLLHEHQVARTRLLHQPPGAPRDPSLAVSHSLQCMTMLRNRLIAPLAAIAILPAPSLLGCTTERDEPDPTQESTASSPGLDDYVGALGEFAGLPCSIVYTQDDYVQFGIVSEGRTLDISERPASACYWFSIYGNQVGWIPYPTKTTLDTVIEVPSAEEVKIADHSATEVAAETSCHQHVEIGSDSFVTMVVREDPEGVQEIFDLTPENVAMGGEQDLCSIATDFTKLILAKIDALAQARAERYAE